MHFVIDKATGEKVYHSRKPFLDLLVKRGTHIYEGQTIEVSEKDAKKFIEEKLKALAEKEAEIDAKMKAMGDIKKTDEFMTNIKQAMNEAFSKHDVESFKKAIVKNAIDELEAYKEFEEEYKSGKITFVPQKTNDISKPKRGRKAKTDEGII